MGLGGVGKSQLAIEYAFKLLERSKHTSVFWVYAGSSERFESAYQEITDKLQIPGRQQPDADIKQLVFNALSDESCGEWLMIVDNADDPALFKKKDPTAGSLVNYIPQSKNGRVLVTSRSKTAATSIVGRHQDIIEVDEMNRSQAMSFLETKLSIPFDKTDASELLETIGHIPLALSHAAAYMNEHKPHVTIQEYLRRFRKSERDHVGLLESERDDDRRDRQSSNAIATTLLISFKHVEVHSSLAADILRLMGYFDRQYIPSELILAPFISDLNIEDDFGDEVSDHNLKSSQNPKRRLHQRLQSLGARIKNRRPKTATSVVGTQPNNSPSNPSHSNLSGTSQATEVYGGLSLLASYSLISLTQDKLAYSMHRLVQLSIRNWIKSESSKLTWPLKAGFSTSEALNEAYLEIDYLRIRTILPHTHMLLQDSRAILGNDPVPGRTQNGIYWFLRAILLCQLAVHHNDTGQLEIGKLEALESIKIYDSMSLSHHPKALYAKITLAQLVHKDESTRAIETYHEVLDMLQKYNIDDRILKARVYHGIGHAMQCRKNWRNAKKYYELALGLSKGFKSSRVTFLELNIADCDAELGNLQQAEDTFREILSRQERSSLEDEYNLLYSKQVLARI